MPTSIEQITVALYEPEIPQNVGNVVRSCAAVGAQLSFIGRLGFVLDDARLRRACVGYIDQVERRQFIDFGAFRADADQKGGRIVPVSKFGRRPVWDFKFADNDILLFGSEAKGLPKGIVESYYTSTVYLPMLRVGDSRLQEVRDKLQCSSIEAVRRTGGVYGDSRVRSLNLATAVGIVLYEVVRQSRAMRHESQAKRFEGHTRAEPLMRGSGESL